MAEVFPFIDAYYSESTFTVRDSFTFTIPDSDLFKAIGIYVGIDIISGVNLSFNFKSIPPISFYGNVTLIYEDLPYAIIPIKCSPMWVYRWDCPDFYSTSAEFSAVHSIASMLKQLLSVLPSYTLHGLVPRFSRSPIREIHFELNPLTQADVRIGFFKLPNSIVDYDGTILNPHTSVPPSGKPDRRDAGNKYASPSNNTAENPYPNSKNFPNPNGSNYGNPSQLGDPSANVDPPRSSIGIGDTVSVGPNGEMLVNGQPANNTLSTALNPVPYRLIKVSHQPRLGNQNYGDRIESYFPSDHFPSSFSFPNPNGACENAYQIHYLNPYNNQNAVLYGSCTSDFRIDG